MRSTLNSEPDNQPELFPEGLETLRQTIELAKGVRRALKHEAPNGR